MRRTKVWIHIVLVLFLAIIEVPPWLMFKGNIIAFVYVLDAPIHAGARGGDLRVDKGGAGTETRNEPTVDEAVELAEKQDPVDERRELEEAQAGAYKTYLEQKPLGFKESDPSLNPVYPAGLPTDIMAADPIENSNPESGKETAATKDEKEDVTPTEPSADSLPSPPTVPPTSPPEPSTEPPPTKPPLSSPPIRRLINTYYARLSATPGTEEAKAQHILVKKALLALPGKVAIRHEFWMDEDDVLNVISFKLEGNSDELEEVAALDGVIGIYPVRTRKRPKALPLGSLQRTRPSLESAHILTGIQAVHQKLGLTGTGIKVDTGVDYKHPALGGCFGPGCKVAYGYDFVGDDYDNGNSDKDTPKLDKDPMDCAGHGTHVAGIVAARNEGPNAMGLQGFVGVAPDATIGAYRVFGCEGEVSDDVLLAALKAAYRDGMDIVNLSLGGSSGWPEEPFATACSAYIQKGLHIAITNGNDGEEGLFEDGAPATAAGAVAVGNIDNTHFLGPAADLVWQSVDRHGKVVGRVEDAGGGLVGRIGMAMDADSGDVPLVAFRSDLTYVVNAPAKDPLGCTPYDEAVLDRENQVPRSNIVVLLRRGGCTFSDKAKLVANAKLGGLLVYDIVPEQRPLGMAVTGFNISAAGLSFKDATLPLNALKAKDTDPTLRNSGRKSTARFSSTDQVLKLASGGKISDFSSYKPDIVTPGGMIYSTFPLAKGWFVTLQGTSMASPYMAGIQALFLSKYGKTDPSLLLRIMQSTAVATIKPGSTRGLTSVFQQGRVPETRPRHHIHQPVHHLGSNLGSRSQSGLLSQRVRGQQPLQPRQPVAHSDSEIGARSVSMTPSQFQLGPSGTGTFRVHIDPSVGLNIQERWLFSGFLEFQCRTSQGASCGSSLVSYGGMHGRLAEIPILNPALTYPALQLDRLKPWDGDKATKSAPSPNDNDDGDAEHYVHSDTGKTLSGHKTKKGDDKTKKNQQKNFFRDQSEHVEVGKGDQDWVQILVAVNFPTGLLTIEAESVCDNDHNAGSSGDRIRSEIGGSGQSRFQIETEEGLAEAESMVAKIELMEEEQDVERLARTQELAFMFGGLYMPYEGYSRVMASAVPVVEPTMFLRRKKSKQSNKHNKESKKHAKLQSKNRKNEKTHKSKSMSGKKKKDPRKKKDRSHHGHGYKGKDEQAAGPPHNKKQGHGDGRSRGSIGRKQPAPIPARPSQPPGRGAAPNCVPRILGLIPNGFNPWSTRTDSTKGNTFQAFAWMGDLLLQNHDANAEPETGADRPGTTSTATKDGVDTAVGDGHKKKNNKKKHHKGKATPIADQAEMAGSAQPDLTRDLPDGRYRLVVKVLKPWGVRGRASNVERWSSPIIIIIRRRK
ncbi:hypothetical protein BGX29_011983 [Mortierella sp. GBA35]|nr:hypothetical protein BGX29_011983 [Mortierella sp. GBA35]